MSGPLLTFAVWLGRKLAVAGLIVLLALAGYGLWLYLQQEGTLEQVRLGRLREAMAERAGLQAAKAEAEAKVAAVKANLQAEETRVKQAAEVVAALRALESWWERWFGDSAQQRANAEQMRRMEELKATASGKMAELKRQAAEAAWTRDGIGAALEQTEARVAELEAAQSRARQFVRQAWDKTKGWLAAALAGYFFGPTLWALLMYFGFARLLVRGRPIVLGSEPAAWPEVGPSRVSLDLALGPGERLRIREKFLQSSDEGVAKTTRFVLDWRIPFTSLACGLTELLELRHPGTAGEYRLTLSNSDDPHAELALIDVPAGASLVLRPRFLAGVVQGAADRLAIRRHWRFFRWQAWVTGQFRYFEFVGPCRLVVAGARGVRAENLAARDGQVRPARRTNQDATIGFTPNLEYRPVRAETFWSYYRGMNPLFDDLFAGRGLFLLQETATPGSAAAAGRFWSGVWSGVLRVFGL